VQISDKFGDTQFLLGMKTTFCIHVGVCFWTKSVKY